MITSPPILRIFDLPLSTNVERGTKGGEVEFNVGTALVAVRKMVSAMYRLKSHRKAFSVKDTTD